MSAPNPEGRVPAPETKWEAIWRIVAILVLGGLLALAILYDWEGWDWIVFLMFFAVGFKISFGGKGRE